MVKGSLACIVGDTITYTQPVGVTDQIGAVRYHAGFVRKGDLCMVLSDPGDWKEMPDIDFSNSNPWTQILLGGQVVWVKSRDLTPLVQPKSSVVY